MSNLSTRSKERMSSFFKKIRGESASELNTGSLEPSRVRKASSAMPAFRGGDASRHHGVIDRIPRMSTESNSSGSSSDSRQVSGSSPRGISFAPALQHAMNEFATRERKSANAQADVFRLSEEQEDALLEGIDQGFFKDDFDPIRMVLEKFGNDVESDVKRLSQQNKPTSDSVFLRRVCEEHERLLGIIKGRLSRRVLSQYAKFLDGLTQVRRVQEDIDSTLVSCDSTRCNLQKVDETLVEGGMKVIRKRGRKDRMTHVLKTLASIKSLLSLEGGLHQMLEDYQFLEALECQSTIFRMLTSADSSTPLKMLRCMRTRSRKFAALSESDIFSGFADDMQEKLDGALMQLCGNFDSDLYRSLLETHVTIGQLHTMMSKLAQSMDTTLDRQCHEVMQSFGLANQEVNPERVKKEKSFGTLCEFVHPDQRFLCLWQLYAVVGDYLYNYKRLMQFHEEWVDDYHDANQVPSSEVDLINPKEPVTSAALGIGLDDSGEHIGSKIIGDLASDLDTTVCLTDDAGESVKTAAGDGGGLRPRAGSVTLSPGVMLKMLRNERKRVWGQVCEKVRAYWRQLIAGARKPNIRFRFSDYLTVYFGSRAFLRMGMGFLEDMAKEELAVFSGMFNDVLGESLILFFKSHHREKMNMMKDVLENDSYIPMFQASIHTQGSLRLRDEDAPMCDLSALEESTDLDMSIDCTQSSVDEHLEPLFSACTAFLSTNVTDALERDSDKEAAKAQRRINPFRNDRLVRLLDGLDRVIEGQGAMEISGNGQESIQITETVGDSERYDLSKAAVVTASSRQLFRLLGQYVHYVRIWPSLTAEVTRGVIELSSLYLDVVLRNFPKNSPPPPPTTSTSSSSLNTGNGNGTADSAVDSAAAAAALASDVNMTAAERVEACRGVCARMLPAGFGSTGISSATVESSDETMYGLKSRIGACESAIYLTEILLQLRPILDSLKCRSSALDELYSNVVIVLPTEIREPMYSPIIDSTLGSTLSRFPQAISSCRWEMNEIGEHSQYVELMAAELRRFSTKAKAHMEQAKVPAVVETKIWESALRRTMEIIVEGYSRVKKCNSTGRAQMSLDLRQLQSALEGLCPLPRNTVPNFTRIADDYIKGYYCGDENDLAEWVNAHRTWYAPKQMTAMVVTGMYGHPLKKKQRAELLQRLQLPPEPPILNASRILTKTLSKNSKTIR